MGSIGVLQVGLGAIGTDMARRVTARTGMQLVGAVDSSPALAGRELRDVLGMPEAPLGLVGASLEEAVEALQPRVALLATTSFIAELLPAAEACLRRGVAVVSTCEELVCPWWAHEDAARRLDAAARAGGTACLGAGINPGFVLDLLPVVLASPVDRPAGVRAWRIVDAAQRREALQRKVGAGLAVEVFEKLAAEGRIGHRGMLESLHLVCAALGLSPEGASSFIRPVVARRAVRSGQISVAPGQVAGIHQGARDAGGRVSLDLRMFLGAEDPQDGVEVEGSPPLRVVVEGGYRGDEATCGACINAVASVLAAPPGLHTVLDLPPPRHVAAPEERTSPRRESPT